METGMFGWKRMEAHMIRRFPHANGQSAIYSHQRIAIHMVEIECGMALCGSSVGNSVLTNDFSSVRIGFVRRTFSRLQSNWEHL